MDAARHRLVAGEESAGPDRNDPGAEAISCRVLAALCGGDDAPVVLGLRT
jgi:hypothetical protein